MRLRKYAIGWLSFLAVKLIECDTPTRFITRHAERMVDIQYDKDGAMFRESLDLDDAQQLDKLSELIRIEKTIRLHSREFQV